MMTSNDNHDNHEDLNDNHDNFLRLSLSPPRPPPPPPPPPAVEPPPALQPPAPAPARQRRSVNHGLRPGKPVTISPPYPWATTRRATAHSLRYLQESGVDAISGRVRCRQCDERFVVEYDLRSKFAEVAAFVAKRRASMHQRAPREWMNPRLPDCVSCGERSCARPVPSEKKKAINWLFLFLGQMIGCCKLSELKYFCKHTRNHRTGAKDRVLYLTYLEICRQLDPEWQSST